MLDLNKLRRRITSTAKAAAGAGTIVGALTLGGCETMPDLGALMDTGNSGLSSDTIASGLREALQVGAGRSVDLLGKAGGYGNSLYRIPLPDKLAEARDISGRFGLSGVFDDLENRLNDAAETAAPKARNLFAGAIRKMSFSDVMGIFNGPDDAATSYLKRTTSAELMRQMRPIVDNSLGEVGAVRTYSDAVGQYNRLPLVKQVDADLGSHVLEYAANGLFAQLAKEEAAIRNDPVKRSTELLQRVFAGR